MMKNQAIRCIRNIQFSLQAAKYSILYGWQYGRVHDNFNLAEHLKAAAEWLRRAHDAGLDDGVSYGAEIGKGFLASYPETTGYIIPTFLNLADYFQDSTFCDRAVAMGEWEIAIQMPSGAVMGGVVNSNPTPAVFNTGQVLLGWSALYKQTNEPRFLDAARRSAQWLIAMQDDNGHWQRGNSQFANQSATLYNAKAAWGLCAAGKAGVGEAAVQAAIKNAEFCVSRQKPNGWFPECCLTDPAQPLLHTIAYTMQGLIGIGKLADRPEFIQAAEKTARSLINLMSSDGFIPGKINDRFCGTVSWCCLTGTAQSSIVWSQLYELTGDKVFEKARRTANRYLMARHPLKINHPAIHGGVYGSWPIWGDYGRLMVLNWATKFFVDSILLEVQQA